MKASKRNAALRARLRMKRATAQRKAAQAVDDMRAFMAESMQRNRATADLASIVAEAKQERYHRGLGFAEANPD